MLWSSKTTVFGLLDSTVVLPGNLDAPVVPVVCPGLILEVVMTLGLGLVSLSTQNRTHFCSRPETIAKGPRFTLPENRVTDVAE